MTYLRSFAALCWAMALVSCAHLDRSAPSAYLEGFELTQRALAFDGKYFGDAGQYEVVAGVASLRADPRAAANSGIVDIEKAAARDGWVHYKTNVVVLRPRDPTRASRVLIVDLPNRGNKLFQYMVNEGNGRILEAGADGIGYTMRSGHTLAWIGWQGDIPLAKDAAPVGMALPLATAHGKPLTGWSLQEAEFGDVKPVSVMRLSYPAAVPGERDARLTVRQRAGDAPAEVTSWRWLSDREIEITRPPRFDAGAVYEFRYLARDPRPMGLGFAALRDVTSWLKSGAGANNPLKDLQPNVTLAVGISQSGRALRDFIWQGFNAGPDGRKVFDGAMPLIAGAKKSFTNFRFAQPGRNSTQHNEHLTPGDQFPFTYAVTRDPLTGGVDGIFARCQASATCPRLMHVDSSTEFWQGRAALIVTDGAGRDVALPPDARAYLISSTQHVYANGPATPGACRYLPNTARQAPAVRALLEDLAAWAREGRLPPPSQYPTLADVKLAEPTAQAVGFPDIRPVPVEYPRVINELAVTNYHAVPPQPVATQRYQLLVPMADEDGHDLAGIRLPDVAVPLATHAGWNLRREVFAEGELCGLTGMMLPLPAVNTPGDPRRSIAQRYPSRLEYAKAVALVARDLRDRGLLLQEDVDRYIERAKTEPKVAP